MIVDDLINEGPRQGKTSISFSFKERYGGSEYDRLFNQAEGYNQYLHRCDREHAKSRGLKVNQEVHKTSA